MKKELWSPDPHPTEQGFSPKHPERSEIPRKENESEVGGLLVKRPGRQTSQGDGVNRWAGRVATTPFSELRRGGGRVHKCRGLRAEGDGKGRSLGNLTDQYPFHRLQPTPGVRFGGP